MSLKTKVLHSNLPFISHRVRNIDEATMVDLLGFVVYEASREGVLGEIGIEDHGSASYCILDYVLDALGVPPQGDIKRFSGEHEKFSKDCIYSRESYYEIVYGDHAAVYGEDQPASEKILAALRAELKRKDAHYK